MAENRTAILTKLIELLEPLNEQERKKTVDAAMMFLKPHSTEAGDETKSGNGDSDEQGQSSQLSRKASTWLKQNGLELSNLEDIFHFEGEEVEVIASDVPGSGSRPKTQHCYLLVAIKNLLQMGEPTIDDKEARKLCEDLGCYDSPNHAKTVKDMRNQIAGDKAKGFTLTTPGLRAGAELLKQLTTPEP